MDRIHSYLPMVYVYGVWCMMYERQGATSQTPVSGCIYEPSTHHALVSPRSCSPTLFDRLFCTTNWSRTATMEVLADLKTHDLEELRPIKG